MDIDVKKPLAIAAAPMGALDDHNGNYDSSGYTAGGGFTRQGDAELSALQALLEDLAHAPRRGS